MLDVPELTVEQVDPLPLRAELREVHRAALGAGALSDDWAREPACRRTSSATTSSSSSRASGTELAGFGYGYTGAYEQWWTEHVARALDAAQREQWLDPPHFEIVELHVRPSWQRRGAGSALLAQLLSRQPHDRALLSTQTGSKKARSFYAKNGWTELADVDFGANYPPYLVLGKRLGANRAVRVSGLTSRRRSSDVGRDGLDLRRAQLALERRHRRRRRPRPGARPSPATASAGRGSGRRCRSSPRPSACGSRRSRPRRRPASRARSASRRAEVVVGRRGRRAAASAFDAGHAAGRVRRALGDVDRDVVGVLPCDEVRRHRRLGVGDLPAHDVGHRLLREALLLVGGERVVEVRPDRARASRRPRACGTRRTSPGRAPCPGSGRRR